MNIMIPRLSLTLMVYAAEYLLSTERTTGKQPMQARHVVLDGMGRGSHRVDGTRHQPDTIPPQPVRAR